MPTDYGFTGQHADVTSGLDYYGARYYDPVAGQFMSADSIMPGGGFDVWGLSRYAYVEGNPVIRTDPSGLCSTPQCFVALEQQDELAQAESASSPMATGGSTVPPLPGSMPAVPSSPNDRPTLSPWREYYPIQQQQPWIDTNPFEPQQPIHEYFPTAPRMPIVDEFTIVPFAPRLLINVAPPASGLGIVFNEGHNPPEGEGGPQGGGEGSPPGPTESEKPPVIVEMDENGNIVNIEGMPRVPKETGTGTRQPEPLPPVGKKVTVWDLIASIFSHWGQGGEGY